jgi:uroporphyrinogen III methyltransferase/synthase
VKTGKIYLVGGGPGEPGLITQKGRDCLAQAEVIIYDRLLDEQLLALAPPQAERIYVGKMAKAHTKSQSEINQLLVTKAMEGKTVVRLKGGDPFVFGRGGEEAQALADNGIPFQIIPGVTTAVAVPAYAGIPVTHRGLASSFAVITGHEDPSKGCSSINWAKLATAVDTLVFLMGMKNLPEIVSSLIKYGRSPDTPVAVIKEGTRPEQETVVGCLGDIATKAAKHHLTPPAVIVVGEVVRLREQLCWFDNLPLFGKRILVTRPRHQAGALSRLLMERGAQPIELPAIGIWPIDDTTELDNAIGNLAKYHWVVFTSTNGVEAFFKRLEVLKLDSRALHGRQIGTIGPATAQALTARGIMPDYTPESYSSEGIIAGLKSHPISGKRFLLPRADIADEELTRGLREFGAEVHEVTAYRTAPEPEAIAKARQMLLANEIQVTTFTSPSAVANLAAAFEGDPSSINSSKVACIGPKTAESAVRAGLKVDIVAREYTMNGLVTAIEEYFERET